MMGANFCPHLTNVCWKVLRLGRAVSSASINHSKNLGNFTNAMVVLVQCRLKGSEEKWAREGGGGEGVFDTRPVTEIKAKNA